MTSCAGREEKQQLLHRTQDNNLMAPVKTIITVLEEKEWKPQSGRFGKEKGQRQSSLVWIHAHLLNLAGKIQQRVCGKRGRTAIKASIPTRHQSSDTEKGEDLRCLHLQT